MATHDYVIANGTGAAVRSDLNGALAAIVSQNSSATEPSPSYAYQRWADTTAGVMKMRNGANNAWISLYELDGTFLAGDISLSAGAAATPSLFFTGDTNTGIYSPGADQVGISTGGTARITVDGSGNVNIDSNTLYVDAANNRVGIGTSGPQASLGFGTSVDTTPTDVSKIQLYNSGGVIYGFGVSANQLNYRAGTAGDAHVWYAGFTEITRMDSSGRLLVGTSTSTQTDAAVTGRVQIESSGSERGLSQLHTANDASAALLQFSKIRGSSVVQNADFLGRIQFNGYDGSNYKPAATIDAQVDGTPGANDMPGRLVFSTTADGAASPTERMRIGQNGQSLFRTNANNNNSTIAAYSDATSGFSDAIVDVNFAGYTPNNATANFAQFRDTTSVKAAIRSNGGLANYQANDVNLSDRNTKKDISSAADTWDCIKEWEIVNYRYKDQPDDADLNLGVIAQQVAERCPEVITIFQEAREATEDAPAQEERLGVKEQQMYWMAIKALQEAIARIETLETEVAALKGA